MKIKTNTFSVLASQKDRGLYLNIFHKIGRHWEGFVTQLTRPQAQRLVKVLKAVL